MTGVLAQKRHLEMDAEREGDVKTQGKAAINRPVEA